MWAVRNNSTESLRLLIEAGCDMVRHATSLVQKRHGRPWVSISALVGAAWDEAAPFTSTRTTGPESSPDRQDICDKFSTCALVLASRDGRTGSVRLLAESGAGAAAPCSAAAVASAASHSRRPACTMAAVSKRGSSSFLTARAVLSGTRSTFSSTSSAPRRHRS